LYNELFQLYQIGKDLGLTRKEINRSLFFKEESHSFKNRIISNIVLLIILILIGATIIIVAQLGFSVTTPSNNTYPSGTRYSTIRIKDFKKKFKGITLKK
jgi:cytoskeletal protein RodZ